MKKIYFLLCFGLLSSSGLIAQIELISTDKHVQWQKSEIEYSHLKTTDINVVITPSVTFQEIKGWGGCFNEKGWKALMYLKDSERNSVMAKLFSDTECAFNYCRMPIGASDYALDYYSLNDNAGDYEMNKFSIDRDRKYLLPYIKAAIEYQPQLQVWGSPWTPPAWMKDNNRYNKGKIRMDKKNLEAYALYFQKYVEAYRAEGVNIVAVHPQNEPLHLPAFPSCGWSGEQLNVFIRDYLGPRFKANVPDCEIWLGTINGNEQTDEFKEYIHTVFSDPKTTKYAVGAGFQWDGDAAIEQMLTKFPNKQIMQTETKCGWGGNDWKYAWQTFDQMHWYLEHNSVYYLQWNMVLDETGMSSWGWKQNSMITIDTYRKEVIVNPQYWIAKHYSHFIKPGAIRIGSTSPEDVNLTAYKNPDDSIVFVIGNNNSNGQKLIIQLEDKIVEVDIKAETINTVIIK